jgi:serine/threonine protein kinase
VPADPIRVQTVFLGAVNLADPDAREAYLEQTCDGDRELRDRVAALLRAHDAPDSLLDEPIIPSSKDATRTHPSQSVGVESHLSFLEPPQREGSLGRIGHYEVLEVLGRGGFGIVFRAFDEVLQRVVAVKVLAPHAAATSPARKRFLREARAAAQIKHENVVQVHAVVEDPLPYLVMEFIPGETLQERMDRTGPLDVPEGLSIGRQMAAGLAAAHEKGLVHRDIKPTNILVAGSPDPKVTITDFGLARAADDASLTRSGIVAGTPMFMAPEQAKGEAVDHRADLFSLGSVLYTMCSGRPPFRAPGTMAVLKRVCDEEPRPIRQIIPEVPEWLCRIIDKLHAKDREARYQTAAEVAKLFADCERQLAEHSKLKDLRHIPKRRSSSSVHGRRWSKAASVLAVLLVVGAGLSVIAYGKSRAARIAAELAMVREQQARALLDSQRYRLPIDEKAGWIRLFNGKDSSGWIERLKSGGWQVTGDGVLQLMGEGALFTTKEYDDFHLVAEVRVDGDADSGVFFRCDPKKLDGMNPSGYEAMINATDQRSPRTGSLMGVRGNYIYGEDPMVAPGQWFTYEVIAMGNEITLKVNGKTTMTGLHGVGDRRSGPIGLQFPGKGRSIQFRNLWIKPLPPRQTSAVADALREKVAAQVKLLDVAKARHQTGTTPRWEVIAAEVDVVEAKLAVAEAESNHKERIRLFEELLKLREEEKRLTEQLVMAKVVVPTAAVEAEGKIADVKARLAKAKADAEGGGKQ